MVAGDRQGVEAADVALDEELLHIAEQLEGEVGLEDALVLRLHLLEDVGLHRAAQQPQGGQVEFLALAVFQGASQLRLDPLALDLLGGKEVHGENGRCRAVDGHRGADPVEVEVSQDELHILVSVDGDAPFADLADAARIVVAVGAVESDGVESDGEARPRHAAGQVVKALVGLLGAAQAGELSGRLAAARRAQRIEAGDEGEVPRQTLLEQKTQALAAIPRIGQGHLRQAQAVDRHRLSGSAELLCRLSRQLPPVLRPFVQQRPSPFVESVRVVGMAAQQIDLPLRPEVVVPDRPGDLRQVAAPGVRHDGRRLGGGEDVILVPIPRVLQQSQPSGQPFE